MIALWVCLGVAGAYITTSAVLTRFPTILHKKKKPKFKCRHISHRGGAGENLENTITAFKSALENGTEMLEIDVQLTCDGVVVVSHDDDLTRCTGHEASISETKFEDLPPLMNTLPIQFEMEPKTVTCQNNDRQIPTLRSLFEQFPTVPMNIDVKRDDDELIAKTIDLVQEFKRHDLVCLGNFRSVVINKIHEKDPDIPILFSMERIALTILLFYTGLLPFIPLKESFFEVPLPRIILQHPTAFKNYRSIIRVADWLLMSPVLFRHLQRRGIQVYLFVINNEDDFDTCFTKLGVDGIMTDYPTKLTHYFQTTDKSTNDEQQNLIP